MIGAGEIAHRLRAQVCFPAPVWQLASTGDSSSKGSNTPFLASTGTRHAYGQKIHTNKTNLFKNIAQLLSPL